MTFWILPSSCRVLARSTVFPLSQDKLDDPLVKSRLVELDLAVAEKIGNSIEDIDDALIGLFPQVPDDIFLPEAENGDRFHARGVRRVPYGRGSPSKHGEMTNAKVVGRKRDADGNPIGLQNANPLLDTRQYEVEFADGATDHVFTANLIAENIYSQIDEEGNSYSIMSEIIDHESDGTAAEKDNGLDVTKDGTTRPRRTTRGWKLLVAWKVIPLKDLKESRHPIQVAEYALANKILEEPAFNWWARHTGSSRRSNLDIGNARISKYGILLPKSVAEALRMDRESGTDFWQRVIEKEMKNIGFAFEFPADRKPPVGYHKIDCHMIVFNMKMTLERKAR